MKASEKLAPIPIHKIKLLSQTRTLPRTYTHTVAHGRVLAAGASFRIKHLLNQHSLNTVAAGRPHPFCSAEVYNSQRKPRVIPEMRPSSSGTGRSLQAKDLRVNMTGSLRSCADITKIFKHHKEVPGVLVFMLLILLTHVFFKPSLFMIP